MGVPAWTCGGIVCMGETYKDKVKLTFAQRAFLPDRLVPVQLESRSGRCGGQL